ncbi:MAG TPA: type 4a pilus biogenesis protein PilO [Tepidisphaeraceae bacterium]|nr:type 4a pilus biogenesis protein PilO [Tepidisphaeraceae bacterium]
MKFGIRELILVGAMVALLVCSYFFVFAKSNQKRLALQSDTAAKRTAMINLQKATAGIDDLGNKIDELQRAISFFEKKLPAEKEVDQILKEVWQMAEANSLQSKQVRTLRAEPGPNCSEQPIQMSLAGDFNGFYAFLLQLEKLPRITRVSQMKLEKIDEHDGEMTAQLTLSIFFEPDAVSASAR